MFNSYSNENVLLVIWATPPEAAPLFRKFICCNRGNDLSNPLRAGSVDSRCRKSPPELHNQWFQQATVKAMTALSLTLGSSMTRCVQFCVTVPGTEIFLTSPARRVYRVPHLRHGGSTGCLTSACQLPETPAPTAPQLSLSDARFLGDITCCLYRTVSLPQLSCLFRPSDPLSLLPPSLSPHASPPSTSVFTCAPSASSLVPHPLPLPPPVTLWPSAALLFASSHPSALCRPRLPFSRCCSACARFRSSSGFFHPGSARLTVSPSPFLRPHCSPIPSAPLLLTHPPPLRSHVSQSVRAGDDLKDEAVCRGCSGGLPDAGDVHSPR